MGRDPRPGPDVRAEVNARIYEYASGRNETNDLWDFVCECGQPDCKARVSLRLADYESLRAAGRAILAAGHRPSHSV